MTGLALAAVLVSAALHATWNALLKRTADPAASAVLYVGGAGALSAALALAVGGGIPSAAWPAVVASGLVEAIYFATLSQALTRLPLGTAYGLVRGGGQLVTWPVSALTLNEAIDARSGMGAALVTLGLASTALNGGPGTGLAWAFACALAVGIYPLTYKVALAHGAHEAALFAGSLAFALPVQIAFLGGTDRASRLRAALSVSVTGALIGSVLCATSFLAFLVALEHGDAGRASALRNTSVLFAAAIGWWSGDPLTPRMLAAFTAIVVGAVLLAV